MVEEESNLNIQLLRASIASIRGASPDDTHMNVRYARFLEILLNAPVRSSSSAAEGAYTGNVVSKSTRTMSPPARDTPVSQPKTPSGGHSTP